ncbi:MAG: hypothetical protein K2Z81_14285, partial [Cyanobacteria bacterium]|nr:hypothetical protein [Cyanobacteriota bacterium]
WLAVRIADLPTPWGGNPSPSVRGTAPAFSRALLLVLLSISVTLGIMPFQYHWCATVLLNISRALISCGCSDWMFVFLPKLMVSLWLLLIPAILIGLIFPLSLRLLVGEHLNKNASSSASAIVYLLSTLGAVAGSIVAAVVFRSAFFVSTIEAVTICASLSYLVLALAYLALEKGWGIKPCSVAVLLIVALLIFKPGWDVRLMSSGIAFLSGEDLEKHTPSELLSMITGKAAGGAASHSIEYYREGENATVTVGRRPRANIVYLKSNGKVEAAVPIDFNRPFSLSDYPTQLLLGIAGSLLCRVDEQRALVIGLGSGTTCGAMSKLPTIGSVTAVEVERLMFETTKYFSAANEDLLAIKPAGKVKLINSDARSFLTASSKPFDIIVSQPAEPWVAGASDLYTREFFSLAKERLTQEGVFCQWVQLYSVRENDLITILNTFQSVFPDTFIMHAKHAGELVMIGFKSGEPVSLEELGARMQNVEVQRLSRRIGITSGDDLLKQIILGPGDVARICAEGSKLRHVNSDDNLLLEFSLANQIHTSGNAEKLLNRLFQLMPSDFDLRSYFSDSKRKR